MEVLACVDDYCVLKLVLTSTLADVPVVINKTMTHEALKTLHPAAKSIVMKTSDDYLTQHVPMMRIIAAQSKKHAQLTGDNETNKAQVDQWLEYSWQELEVPVQALLSLTSNAQSMYTSLSTAEKEQLEAKALKDIGDHLNLLEDHLSSRTFMVSERVTLADISILAVYHTILFSKWAAWGAHPALVRWFMTVRSEPTLQAVLGDPSSFETEMCANRSVITGSSSTLASDVGSWDRHRVRVKEALAWGKAGAGKSIVLKGWVRTCRSADKGELWFVELTDGSTIKGIQLVLNNSTCPTAKAIADCGGVGASLSVNGTVVESQGKGQVIEIHVNEVTVLGPVYGGDNGEIGGKNYPMAKKAHTLEFLREKAHLRPRSKVFSCAARMRSAMAFATHKFFNERSFVYVHTPLITAADCEGAGEQFVVTTLLPDEHGKVADIPARKNGEIDYSKDFFGRQCCLSVSGQLNVETHACALCDVYTFGPTFRAENSHTSRHLAEFWMIEPEICFAELSDNMSLAEDYVRYCAAYALEHCPDDLNYFENEYPNGEKGLRERLQNVVDNEFARVTYTEAVELLQTHTREKKVKFKVYPNWGDDLGSEHERYICEKVYQKPTIVTNYPKGIKAFYMKLNDDNETVAAMDILVPKIGELIGGSQREDDLKVLETRCVAAGLKVEDIWWYADLRRYGSVPHSGFGLGFERLIMFVTGLENIRDVIPFPRVPGHAEF